MTPRNRFKKLLFNFHHIAGVQIDSDNIAARNFFLSEYKNYQVEFLPRHLPCVRLIFTRSGIFSAKKKGYARHVHKFFARFCYRVRITDKDIKINVIGNPTSISIVHHFLVQPSLRLLVSKNNTVMLHASAVYKNEYSVIFTGQSGKGKTTAISLILTKGNGDWDFHSDDYVFFALNGSSLTYQTPLHIFGNHLKWVPELRDRLTFQERIKLYFFGLLRQLSREKIKMPVRVPHDRLWLEQARQKKLSVKAILLIDQSADNRFYYRHLEPDNEIVERLFAMNFAELENFLMLIGKNGNIHRLNEWVDNWRDREKKLLRQQFKSIKIYQIQFPDFCKEQNKGEINRFFEFLDSVISS